MPDSWTKAHVNAARGMSSHHDRIRRCTHTANRASGTTASASAPTLTSRSEEHTSELQSLMRISYAVFCLKKKTKIKNKNHKTVTRELNTHIMCAAQLT